MFKAVARDTCGKQTETPGQLTTLCIGFVGVSSSVSRSGSPSGNEVSAGETPIQWVSQLDVPDASGQVVLNGRSATFVSTGRLVSHGRAGPRENRVEGLLVTAAGRPGTWRFELGGVEPGSLRVIAGDVVSAAADAIVFRVKGRAGERVVFTFRKG